ncbi:DUF4157 domain-containing protein [Spirulina sp. CS-785/01]|uniref:eCIS core domain-containing protein n=1 Tax=Spirulina sp. CS-785/01 TaxID=3021716 RepID=UPI0023308EEE|nr:DUF4157 domain-containing protein [Spirulina sp. CS-785/01]MDB9313552.1 DUF4157 domain-containing protein [Spirulina sp. CS-785/01]
MFQSVQREQNQQQAKDPTQDEFFVQKQADQTLEDVALEDLTPQEPTSEHTPIQRQHNMGTLFQSPMSEDRSPRVASPLQAKLTIGAANDPYEQEADRVAKTVVQRIHTREKPQATEEESVQRSPNPSQRPIPIRPLVQRQETMTLDGGEASRELESSLNQAKGSGQSLDPTLQRSMGQAMGADFSGVKIHTDSQSDQLNHSLQARAFTTGQHVFFKKGEYNPSSKGGQELIAHELTHVVQQNGDGVKSNINRAPYGIIQRNRLRFADEDSIFAELNDVADTAAAHMGTGDTGPTVGAVSKALDGGSAPDKGSDVLLGSGSAELGKGVTVGHVGGGLGATTNIFNTYVAIRDLAQSIKSARDATAKIEAAKKDLEGGETGLRTSVGILDKQKGTDEFNIGEEVGNILSGLNGITNGVTTFWAACGSGNTVAAISGGTFLGGAAAGSILGTVAAIRSFRGARRKYKQLKAIQSTMTAYEAKLENYESQITEKKAAMQAWKDKKDSIFAEKYKLVNKDIPALRTELKAKAAAYDAAADDPEKQAEIKWDIDIIHIKLKGIDSKVAELEKQDPDPNEYQQAEADALAKGKEIPMITQMLGSLETSAAQHERSAKSKIAEGSLAGTGAVGAAALTVASSVGAAAALATPIGWGIVGAVAIGALVYGIGKYVNKAIKKSNVTRMEEEQKLLNRYIEHGTILKVGKVTGFDKKGDPMPGTPSTSPDAEKQRKGHTWYRKNFPTKEQKGWFNKLFSKKKSGKLTIQKRLEEIKDYMAKYAVTTEKGDVMYDGIVEALTTPKGSESITLEVDGEEKTITLKEAITQLLASKDISADDVVFDVESGYNESVKKDLIKAMKLNHLI